MPTDTTKAAEPDGTEAKALQRAVPLPRGPLIEDDEPDVYEMMMLHAPSPFDFEPCERPCLNPDCPCHYRDDR